MNFLDFFNPKGANPWHLASSFLLNFLWTGFTLVVVYYFLQTPAAESSGFLQLGALVSVFVGAFMAGLVFGTLAADGRGPTYGAFGSLGSVTLSLFFFATIGGIVGIMLAIIAIAGGFNGGLLSLRKPPKKK
jgi:hypothetical protein